MIAVLITLAADKAPKDEDVVAGWVAFGIFIALGIAVVLLGISLTKHLKKVDRAAEQGLYDPSTRRKTTPQIPQA